MPHTDIEDDNLGLYDPRQRMMALSARAAMQTMRDDGGRIMGLFPAVPVVPPDFERAVLGRVKG